jgi:carbon-monoxide dehydrogenase iron sulfur subunit
MKLIYPQKNFCMGCRLCEIACLTVNSESRDLKTAYCSERLTGLVSKIKVFNNKEISIAVNCRHCADPECVKSCISGALKSDFSSGTVEYDKAKCLSCFSCVAACPYGAVFISPAGDHVAFCDLCSERLEGPACVEACPNAALVYEER